MEVRRIEETSLFEKSCIVTIGAFDSVHLGHKRLLDEVRKQKEIYNNKYKTVVITFDNHPDYYLNKRKNVGYLEDENRRKQVFESYGIDYLVILNKEVLTYNYKDFHKKVLDKINTKIVVVGSDFCYGYKKTGNVKTLKEDYDVIDLLVLKENGDKISSSEIRKSLEKGDVEIVTKLLGRPYTVEGVVEKGAGLGRQIGIPTANIKCPELGVKLADGVYGTKVIIDEKEYLGITNVGKNPTVNTQIKSRIETHIIDFKGDLYGKNIVLQFLKYIRGEMKFDSVDELVKMIKKNIEDFKKVDK